MYQKRKQKWRNKKNFKLKQTKKYARSVIEILINIRLYVLFLLFYLYFHLKIKKNVLKIPFSQESPGKNDTKICICTLGKEENLYVREYLEHYFNLGINKVYISDNNDINGEKFEDVISDYIEKGLVEIYNWRGKYDCQFNIMNECYKKHKNEYDWIMFSEFDEFIHLYNNYTKVSTFLDEPKFNNCEIVYLNLACHTDDGQTHYVNKPLKERFPHLVTNTMIGGQRLEIKFILRGNLKNAPIYCVHRGNMGLKNCNGFGHVNKYKSIFTTEPDTTYYYYDHYYGKSTEEFIKKIKRGVMTWKEDRHKFGRIKKYFEENELTMEKILMIENGTGFDLSSYKRELEKKK